MLRVLPLRLNLGSCQISALYDDEVNALLDVDSREESAIYMTAVGRVYHDPDSAGDTI